MVEQPGKYISAFNATAYWIDLIILMLHLLMVLKTTGMPTPSAV